MTAIRCLNFATCGTGSRGGLSEAVWKVPSGTSESSPTLQRRGQARLSPYGTEAITEGRAFCSKFRVILTELHAFFSTFRVIFSEYRANNSDVQAFFSELRAFFFKFRENNSDAQAFFLTFRANYSECRVICSDVPPSLLGASRNLLGVSRKSSEVGAFFSELREMM